MKLVFTISEVADALQLTEERFLEIKSRLESYGFPQPIPGLEDRWPIIDIIRWVNKENAISKASSTEQ